MSNGRPGHGGLPRLRRLAARSLQNAPFDFGEVDAVFAEADGPPRAARPSPGAGSSAALRQLMEGTESSIQEFVNAIIPYIENALRNRRDFGAP